MRAPNPVAPTPDARRVAHDTVAPVPSPSGLPTRHLVSASRTGSRSLFLAEQTLRPGDRVLLHTHPVEETLTFLAGEGDATLGDETVPIGPGITLYVPAGTVHGFRCTTGPMRVLVAFPTPEFAETVIVESRSRGAASRES